jgi:hypothetical protein
MLDRARADEPLLEYVSVEREDVLSPSSSRRTMWGTRRTGREEGGRREASSTNSRSRAR